MDIQDEMAAALYTRRHEAVSVPFRADPTGEFQPEPNDCHANVTGWCQTHPEHKVVRGWLVLDYTNVNNRFRFFAHSIIEDENGNRFDITRPPLYPFLEHHLTEEEYVLFVSKQEVIFIDHRL